MIESYGTSAVPSMIASISSCSCSTASGLTCAAGSQGGGSKGGVDQELHLEGRLQERPVTELRREADPVEIRRELDRIGPPNIRMPEVTEERRSHVQVRRDLREQDPPPAAVGGDGQGRRHGGLPDPTLTGHEDQLSVPDRRAHGSAPHR